MKGEGLLVNEVKAGYMKRVLIVTVLVLGMGVVVHAQRKMDPSFRYYAQPGLVNNLEFNYGLGMNIFEIGRAHV